MLVLMMVIFTEEILRGKLHLLCRVGYVLHIVRFIIEVPGFVLWQVYDYDDPGIGAACGFNKVKG